MSESTYSTMEMKDIVRILSLAVWRSHAVAVVASMLAAIFVRLYGPSTYHSNIPNPKNAYTKSYFDATFWVQKNNKLRLYGVFCTKRFIPEAWNTIKYDD